MLLKLIAYALLSSASAGTEIEKIKIEGLVRIRPHVIYTELEHCNCIDNANEVEQALLSTGLFYAVDIQSANGSISTITLQEKWTTIPILKFNSGGGVQQTTFGIYDPNILGRRIELGTQYESLAGAPSLVFWNKVPRLFESKFFSDLQIWKTQRARLKYNPSQNEPVLIKALLQKSNRDYFSIGYEFNPELKFRIGIESQSDSFSTDRIPTDTLAQVAGQTIPNESKVYFFGGQIEYGRLKSIRHSPVGWLTSANLKYGFAQSTNQSDFQSFRGESVYYKLTDNFVLASRIQVGSTSTDLIQHWNYLGGFESIRGFVDNRFATKNYWLINLESRYFLKEREKYILQATTFLDTLGIDEDRNNIQNIHAASIGAGARIILPTIYRLTIRFDLALPIVKTDSQKVSFGVQQFF